MLSDSRELYDCLAADRTIYRLAAERTICFLPAKRTVIYVVRQQRAMCLFVSRLNSCLSGRIVNCILVWQQKTMGSSGSTELHTTLTAESRENQNHMLV